MILFSVIIMGATINTIINTIDIIVENQSDQIGLIDIIMENQATFSEILVTLAQQDNTLMDMLLKFRDSLILPEIMNYKYLSKGRQILYKGVAMICFPNLKNIP